MRKNNPFLSIIIPVFNEDKRVNKLTEISIFLKNLNFATELIIVNDGSTDTTLKKIKNFRKSYRFLLINYSKNLGKGYALKQGILMSKGKYILFSDIDLSTPLEEFEKFKKYLEKYNVIIGTRKNSASSLIKRQSPAREYMGKAFTALSRIVLQLDISDFTCGFKCFSKQAGHDIFKSLKNNRWGFDAEALFIAKKRGYKIKEVPVVWANDPKTKVKFPQDIIISLIELLKVRFRKY